MTLNVKVDNEYNLDINIQFEIKIDRNFCFTSISDNHIKPTKFCYGLTKTKSLVSNKCFKELLQKT